MRVVHAISIEKFLKRCYYKATGVMKMITYIAGKITSFFITRGVIEHGEKEIYVYSFEMTISFLANLAIVLTLSIITGKFAMALFYLAGFMPIRMAGGGYHAKSHLRCMLTLIVVYLFYLICSECYPGEWRISTSIIIMVTGSVLIYLLAPLEDENHPLTVGQKDRLKKRTWMFMGISCGLVFIGSFFEKSGGVLFAFSSGYLTAALSMFAGAMKIELGRMLAVWKDDY